MSRMSNARKGIGFGIINNILNILLPFVSRTIIIYTLGNQYLGLGGLFTSIINVLNISELGFSTAVAYILYKPIADKDEAKVCAILSFARKCFTAIGIVVLVGGLVVMPFLKKFISGDVPDGINIYVLYLFYLANVVISYIMFSYKRILFSANQRYDLETKIASVTVIIQQVIQIAVLLLLKNYYLFVLAFPVATFINNLLCQSVTKRMYPQYFCKGTISSEEVGVLKQKISGSFFSKLGDTVYLSVNNIVISSIFGLLVLGKYSNYYYVITSLIAIFAIVHNTLRPIIGNCIVTESKDENFGKFITLNNIYVWLTAFCSCCLVCLYQDFIAVWAGEDAKFTLAIAVLFAAYFFSGRISAVVTLFLESAGLWWEIRYFALCSAGVSLVLSIVLAKCIGLAGVLIASVVSMLGVTMIGHVRVLFKHYFDKVKFRQYLKSMLFIVASSLAIIGVTFLVASKITVSGWFSLLCKGAVTAVMFAALYFIVNIKNKESRSAWGVALRMFGLHKLFKTKG